MNKKEQKVVEDLKVKLALRWTDSVEKDISAPKYDEGLVVGYFFNAYNMEVTKGCSHSVGHSRYDTEKTSSQNAVSMYSSKLLALKAMRNVVEINTAIELKKIDDKIEAEVNAAIIMAR